MVKIALFPWEIVHHLTKITSSNGKNHSVIVYFVKWYLKTQIALLFDLKLHENNLWSKIKLKVHFSTFNNNNPQLLFLYYHNLFNFSSQLTQCLHRPTIIQKDTIRTDKQPQIHKQTFHFGKWVVNQKFWIVRGTFWKVTISVIGYLQNT